MKNDNPIVVVGLGKTGISVIRYLINNGSKVIAVDDRMNPPALEELKNNFPDVPYYLGPFDEQLFMQASTLIVSPGLSLNTPAVKKCRDSGIEVIGDIELFASAAKKPIIAITGSNGKSTVVTLIGAILKDYGKRVGMGGNLGTPALDLLNQEVDYYVLELSSFQLETTYSLRAEVTTVLNLSEDHMDRYQNVEEYLEAKLRIYNGAATQVINLDEPRIHSRFDPSRNNRTVSFSLNNPHADFNAPGDYLLYHSEKIMAVDELKMRGRHNVSNALAALAIGHSLGVPISSMATTLRSFSGLEHRCQWIRTIDGISWYDDSKGTNVGATRAAIAGLGATLSGKKIILIAGGIGKGADFFLLSDALEKHVKLTILMGQDATLIHKALESYGEFLYADSMTSAVKLAHNNAQNGDIVLLSPACSSLDMFDNFEHRGNVFISEVNGIWKETDP